MSKRLKRKMDFPENIWFGWLKICKRINDFIESLFESHTRFVARNCRGVILVSILFIVTCTIGFLWFKPLSRSEELFIPQNSQAMKDLDKSSKYYTDRYRIEEALLFRKDNSDISNDIELFKRAFQLHKKISNIEGFKESCLSVMLGDKTQCLYVTPLQVFNYEESKINNITDKLNSWLQNPRLLFFNGRPASLNFKNLFGRYKQSSDGKKVVSFNGIRMVYYVKYVETADKSYNDILAFEKRFIDLCASLVEGYNEKNTILRYSTSRTRDDAVLESTVGDLPLFSIAFGLMVVFCLLIFMRIKNSVTGHLSIAIAGIIVIMLGIGSGFGIAMWGRTDFVAFTGILLFLVLGIGMDNMFIMVDAVDMVDFNLRGEERLVEAMKHVGGSIAMTTTTDLVAFAVSTVSSFPSVHLFCVYASLSIFVTFILLNTLFLALLYLDIKRIENGQRDIGICCVAMDEEKLGNPWWKENEDLSKRMMERWARFLMTIPMRIIVFIAACGLLAAGIYGTTKVSEYFDWRKVAPDGSYFRDYANAMSNFPAGYGVSVILPESLNYADVNIQNEIKALDLIAYENKYYQDFTINWIQAYSKWAAANNVVINGKGFYRNMSNFLFDHPIYVSDIVLSKDKQRVLSSRLIFFYYDTERNNIRQASSMETIRKDLVSKTKIAGIYTSSFPFIYAESYLLITPNTIQNLAISAATILVITLPYLMHPGITGIVFISFVSLLFELVGLMAAWDVSLDTIAMLVIIMSIGFSVDYTCHIAHAYMTSPEGTPEERVVDALVTMGTSVLNGGFSTFLGMLVTAFSKAEAFRIFFKMVFGIVALGLLHGLVFLPVILSIFVRRDLRKDMKTFVDRRGSLRSNRSVRKNTRKERKPKSRDDPAKHYGIKNPDSIYMSDPNPGIKVEPIQDENTDQPFATDKGTQVVQPSDDEHDDTSSPDEDEQKKPKQYTVTVKSLKHGEDPEQSEPDIVYHFGEGASKK